MNCATIKKGTECSFMTSKGCSYNGGICNQIVEQCNGCNRGTELSSGWYCTACPERNCNLATHLVVESNKAKAKINPLKASKRRSR
jgi:hypothetical protein